MKLKLFIAGIIFSAVFFTIYIYTTSSHFIEQQHETTMNNHSLPLTESGNDIFGTIQEVINKLDSNPETDWSKVNIEALKEHLLDMRDMVINVEVIDESKLKNGSKILIRPTSERSTQAMKRVLSAHPEQLKKETNWQMQVEVQGENYLLITTTDNPMEANKIIGLGYIGLMAYGSHHQPHHWFIATGNDPHSH